MVAQIILFPYIELLNPIQKHIRENNHYSTVVVAWTLEITRQRPLNIIQVEEKSIQGILDTGADKSCMAGKDWPGT